MDQNLSEVTTGRSPKRGGAPSRSGASTAGARERIGPILDLLDQVYPDAWCTLDFQNPYQLLVATILSAQCTDERVNQLTPALFAKYPDLKALASADRKEVEDDIRPTGFYRNKAKSLQEAARIIVKEHGGEIPTEMDALVELPGIGRKTANVILGTAFETATGVVVDTHVKRVSQRLGLTREKDPTKIEQDLIGLVPRERWVKFSHQMILHGRHVCKAQRSRCDECVLSGLCPSAFQSPHFKRA